MGVLLREEARSRSGTETEKKQKGTQVCRELPSIRGMSILKDISQQPLQPSATKTILDWGAIRMSLISAAETCNLLVIILVFVAFLNRLLA